MKSKQSVEERFWAKVDSSGGPTVCWPWKASLRTTGYGQFGFKGKSSATASRVAYELTYGPIPKGLNVLHHCDNPKCCNPHPTHLFLGTQKENLHDAFNKGRLKVWKGTHLVGEGHPFWKYSNKLRQQVIEEYVPRHVKPRHLAEKYGIPVNTIKNWLYGAKRHNKDYVRPSGFLSVDDVRQIRSIYELGGRTYQSIADQFKVSKSCIQHIMNRRNFKHID